jgi:TatD DNase family protein
MKVILPFDSHNHIHMGPSSPQQALTVPLSGMAIMSTHPRDFSTVLDLSTTLSNDSRHIVPCFGIHPWFLHKTESNWMTELEYRLAETPHAIVGEIGLDGFHFDANTQQLTSSLEDQKQAFLEQMELAAQYDRPVSIHTVHCFGTLFESLSLLKKKKKLPSQMYFHAFGGKVGTVDQLIAACKGSKVYFGFAPVINFRSPKTADVIRKVGLSRLLLETDHEDAAYVPESVQSGIRIIAEALGCAEQEVIETTTANAFQFYRLSRSK